MVEGSGKRLERYVKGRWADVGEGGIRGFCRATGITPQALYLWFSGANEPKMGHLTEMSKALRVQRWELVAAMDGFDLDAARREAVAEEVDAALAPIRSLMRDAGLLQEATAPSEEPHEVPQSSGRAA